MCIFCARHCCLKDVDLIGQKKMVLKHRKYCTTATHLISQDHGQMKWIRKTIWQNICSENIECDQQDSPWSGSVSSGRESMCKGLSVALVNSPFLRQRDCIGGLKYKNYFRKNVEAGKLADRHYLNCWGYQFMSHVLHFSSVLITWESSKMAQVFGPLPLIQKSGMKGLAAYLGLDQP